jgi:lysophospholipase L1-like esterase
LIGASYAAGWKDLVLPGREVVNVGVSGQQSFELLARFDADVVARRPRAVIIWGFINDIFNAKRPELDQALARTQRSIIEMAVRARAHGIEPILATEVTIRRKAGLSESIASVVGPLLGKSAYYDYVNRHVLDGNAWLRELAAQQDIMLLDLQPVVSDRFARRRAAYAQPDGSHITEPGYKALSQYAQPRLVAHLAASRPATASEEARSR